jgi:hypothetical protein
MTMALVEVMKNVGLQAGNITLLKWFRHMNLTKRFAARSRNAYG